MNTIRINNLELALLDAGHGSQLVLVHGFPLNHAMWEGQIPVLAQQHRVTAPDLRGFGGSSVTPGTVTMKQFADDLAALLDALAISQPIVLMGLSMGGYIALEFWRKHRQRLGGLILCDTRAGVDTPEAAAGRLTMADRVLREGSGILVDAMLPKLLAPSTMENHPHIAQCLSDMMRTADPQGVAAAQRGMAERHDFTSQLSQINCPTLVVVGRHDAVSPPQEMAAMAKAIPRSRFVEIEAAGHMSPLENPAAVNAAVLEFLSS